MAELQLLFTEDPAFFTIRAICLLVMLAFLGIFWWAIRNLPESEDEQDSWFGEDGQEDLYRDFN